MDLTGKILIAMPAMGDPRFERGVVLICSHSGEGAMGLIINKPIPDLAFPALLDQVGVTRTPACRTIPVLFGGPVEQGRGFVLHSADWTSDKGTMPIPGGLAMTATQDVLDELGTGAGPQQAVLALGYAGWGPGQLETEIARNDWLTADLPEGLAFGPDSGGKWAAALASMRVDPLTLSAAAGRA